MIGSVQHCEVKACIQPPRANGYCRAHQWVIDGNALGSVAASKTIPQEHIEARELLKKEAAIAANNTGEEPLQGESDPVVDGPAVIDNRMQWEIALGHCKDGADDAESLADRMKIDRSRSSAFLSILCAKKLLSRSPKLNTGQRGLHYRYAVVKPPEPCLATASERIEETETTKVQTRVTERSVTVEVSAKSAEEFLQPEKTPPPPLPEFAKLPEFIPIESPKTSELIEAVICFYCGPDLDDFEVDRYAANLLPGLAHEVYNWREAKRLTDAALEPLSPFLQGLAADHLGAPSEVLEAWKSVHKMVLDLLSKKAQSPR